MLLGVQQKEKDPIEIEVKSVTFTLEEATDVKAPKGYMTTAYTKTGYKLKGIVNSFVTSGNGKITMHVADVNTSNGTVRITYNTASGQGGVSVTLNLGLLWVKDTE